MSKLSDTLQQHSLNNDTQGLADTLTTWPERDSEWLMYVEIRISAPSSTDEQREALIKVRDAWAAEAERVVNAPDVSQREKTKSTPVDLTSGFHFSDQEKRQLEIIEQIESLEDAPSYELEAFIASLDIPAMPDFLQHYVNGHIYGLLILNDFGDFTRAYVQTEIYQSWSNHFTAEKVIVDRQYSNDHLIRYCDYQYQVEVLRRKSQFLYSVEQEKMDLSYSLFMEKYAPPYVSYSRADTEQITAFENKYGVKLPASLKSFYLKVGSVAAEVYTNSKIFSLSDLNYLLESGDRNRRLQSFGVVSMLDFVWSNDKPEFKPEAGYLTTKNIAVLNGGYHPIGYLQVDDNVYLVPYFDANHRFGVVWYNQDDGDVFTDYLDLMLVETQAHHDLAPILGSLLILLSTPYMSFEYLRDFVLRLRHG